MATVYGLTETDVKVLKGLLEAHRGRQRNNSGRAPVELDDQPAPDTYVALTPSGGIPALDPSYFGTGGSVGTGTAVGEGDLPGSADCDIYQLVTYGIVRQLE